MLQFALVASAAFISGCGLLGPQDSKTTEVSATEFPVYTTSAPAPATATPFNSPLISSATAKAAGTQTADTPEANPALTTGLYRVEAGDTLSGIAEKFQISIDDIRKLNPELAGDNIFVGQILTIESLVTPTATSDVPASPTAVTNATPHPSTGMYLVKGGDAAILIAEAYGITFEELQILNPEVDLGTVFIGQVLNVPK
jgi:LysM repeat protein